MSALLSFTYQALPMRVCFGAGAMPVAARGGRPARAAPGAGAVQPRAGRRPAGLVAAALGDRSAGVLAEARMHVPVEVADGPATGRAELGADGCVAVGGGSAIGLGKAIALEHGLPVVAVPTTYAGSEMTPVWGLTEGGQKRTGRDPRVLPAQRRLRPRAHRSTLPAAHVGDQRDERDRPRRRGALRARRHPDHLADGRGGRAGPGRRAARRSSPTAPTSTRAAEALYGAWLCGACLGATTMSLHHKLCHALGGTLDLPHAPTHTVVLPHALAYNQPAAPDAVAALSRALGRADDPALRLWDLAGELGASRSLRELGMAETDIPKIVEQVLANPYANPVEVTEPGLTRLLRRAWAGDPPAA